jgi:SAM-dependent methyltransferase
VLLRDDDNAAYPIVDGFPVLMAPEALVRPAEQRAFNLNDPRYEEAYAEMAFYNRVAEEEGTHITDTRVFRSIRRIIDAGEPLIGAFPRPPEMWLDSAYDLHAQWDTYLYMAPLADTRVLEVGGKGIHVVKFLVVGASEGWLVTPMVAEARFAIELARACGVGDRLHCVIGVGEELPFAPETFDRVYVGSTLHHMDTAIALPEAARVLKPGGRYGAVEPWRAPLYGVGTKILGQREAKLFGRRNHGVYCRPLTSERIGTLERTFRTSRVVQHGTLTRYLLIALDKLGLHSRVPFAWKIGLADDRVSALLRLRRWGSSSAVLATKAS